MPPLLPSDASVRDLGTPVDLICALVASTQKSARVPCRNRRRNSVRRSRTRDTNNFAQRRHEQKKKTEPLHLDVESALREQLGAAQEVNRAKLDSVASDLMKRFETGLYIYIYIYI